VVLRVSMDGQKRSCFRIMAGRKARTKAMKIAVSVPGKNIYIVFINEIDRNDKNYMYIFHLQGWKRHV
jgi:hypothetical protein